MKRFKKKIRGDILIAPMSTIGNRYIAYECIHAGGGGELHSVGRIRTNGTKYCMKVFYSEKEWRYECSVVELLNKRFYNNFHYTKNDFCATHNIDALHLGAAAEETGSVDFLGVVAYYILYPLYYTNLALNPPATHFMDECLKQMELASITLYEFGFYHCDIKPDNYVWKSEAPHSPICLIDFDRCVHRNAAETYDLDTTLGLGTICFQYPGRIYNTVSPCLFTEGWSIAMCFLFWARDPSFRACCETSHSVDTASQMRYTLLFHSESICYYIPSSHAARAWKGSYGVGNVGDCYLRRPDINAFLDRLTLPECVKCFMFEAFGIGSEKNVSVLLKASPSNLKPRPKPLPRPYYRYHE
jgi:serine/threonine protein kinase